MTEIGSGLHKIELTDIGIIESTNIVKLKVTNENNVAHKYLDRHEVVELILRLQDLERKMVVG